MSTRSDPVAHVVGPHDSGDHGDGGGHDDHGHDEGSLGPIDPAAWILGGLGVVLGLVVAAGFALATGRFGV